LQILTKDKYKDTISLTLEPNLKAAQEITQYAPSKNEIPIEEDMFKELREGNR